MRPVRTAVRQGLDVGLTQYMLRIYQYMGLGLGLTSLVIMLISFLPPEIQAGVRGLSLFAVLGTFGIVFYLNTAAGRISVAKAGILFWIYAFLMGISLSNVVVVYQLHSVGFAFFATSISFGAMAVYGSKTQRDLTSLGSFLTMGVAGLLVAMLVSFFVKSQALNFMTAAFGVLIFTGLTAYDTQKLRNIYYELPYDETIRQKMAIYGALTLYLDVINLFLAILRLTGDRKEQE